MMAQSLTEVLMTDHMAGHSRNTGIDIGNFQLFYAYQLSATRIECLIDENLYVFTDYGAKNLVTNFLTKGRRGLN